MNDKTLLRKIKFSGVYKVLNFINSKKAFGGMPWQIFVGIVLTLILAVVLFIIQTDTGKAMVASLPGLSFLA